MDNNGKWKSFAVSNKINILAQNDAHISSRAELAQQLRLSASMLNIVVKNREETERRYVRCDLFPGSRNH
jgi:hypothetical protein